MTHSGRSWRWAPTAMMAPHPVASRSPDRTGPGQGAPSAREMTIGQDFPSPNQPDKTRRSLCNVPIKAGIALDSLVVLPFSVIRRRYPGNLG